MEVKTTELQEIKSRDYGIEEPHCWGPWKSRKMINYDNDVYDNDDDDNKDMVDDDDDDDKNSYDDDYDDDEENNNGEVDDDCESRRDQNAFTQFITQINWERIRDPCR